MIKFANNSGQPVDTNTTETADPYRSRVQSLNIIGNLSQVTFRIQNLLNIG